MTALRGVLKECWRLGLLDADRYRRTVDAGQALPVEALPGALPDIVSYAVPYASLIEAQRRGFIDIGYYGPRSYIQAVTASGGKIEAFAQAMWGGGPYREKKDGYHSYIIVKADSPYRSVGDLRGKVLALTDPAFNLNGVQATTHMASPLLVVNGPVRTAIGMNAGCNAFGSGNRTSRAWCSQARANVQRHRVAPVRSSVLCGLRGPPAFCDQGSAMICDESRGPAPSEGSPPVGRRTACSWGSRE